MKNKNIFLSILIVFAAFFMACEKQPILPPIEQPVITEPEPEPEPEFPLKGTKWKLAGIVDAQTGNLKVLEPQDCDRCYTLEFETDTSGVGGSVANWLVVRLTPKVAIWCATHLYDTREDSRLFEDFIERLQYYEKRGDKLKFYDNNHNYLLYKLLPL